jgi:hypothetical protein
LLFQTPKIINLSNIMIKYVSTLEQKHWIQIYNYLYPNFQNTEFI